MGHGPAVKLGKDNAASYKTKIGVSMFIAYLLVYALFVGINTVSPKVMDIVFMGQTLAVIYGFGLIIFALVLAVIYNHLCTSAETRMNK